MAAVHTPVVAAPFAAPPPAASQWPDPKSLRTVSLRPGATQIATTTPSAADSGEAVHASDGPQPLAKLATKGASEAAGVAQPSTHKLDLPTKLSGKPSARPVVAKTETAALGPEADKGPEVPAGPQAASQGTLARAQRTVDDPLSHAFGYIVGALGVAVSPAQQPAVKGVTSEERPIELGDHASPGNVPASANLGPASAGAAQPTAGASYGPPVTAAAVNTPVVAAPFAAPPSATSQFPDSKASPSGRVIVSKTETAALGPEAGKAPETPLAQQSVNPCLMPSAMLSAR